MPNRDGPKCSICWKVKAPYKCSTDSVPYCSVGCYKQHKERDCKGQVATPLQSDVQSFATIRPVYHQDDEQLSPQNPLKPLADLSWPSEPDPALFCDPLARDDIKPLRRFQFEAIATSPSIRSQLESQPDLIKILKTIKSESHLRSILNLPDSDSQLYSERDRQIFRKFADVAQSVLHGDAE